MLFFCTEMHYLNPHQTHTEDIYPITTAGICDDAVCYRSYINLIILKKEKTHHQYILHRRQSECDNMVHNAVWLGQSNTESQETQT